MSYAITIVVFVATFILGGIAGDKIGIDRQKTVDQYQFDKINIQLADQKRVAAETLDRLNAENLKLILDRDTLKTTLEKRYADAQAVTTSVRRELSTLKLRFTVETGRAGGGSISSASPEVIPASLAGAALIELPEKITSDLRLWAEDADALRDAYAICYGWTTQVR